MTSGSWYAQRKAYEDAGLWTQITDASSSLATCSQCGICVGPDYTQNVLFLYHVVNQYIWIANDTRPFIKDDYLITCEDCARSQHKRAKKKGGPLPEAYMIMHPFLWKTKALINGTMDPLGSEPSVELLQGIQIYVQLLIDFLRCYLYKKPIPFTISQIFYQLPELLQIPQWKAYWQACSPEEQQSIIQTAKPMFATADTLAHTHPQMQTQTPKVTSIHTTQPIPSYSQVSTTETRTPSFSRSRYTFRRPA
jgi:hypothetical protein